MLKLRIAAERKELGFAVSPRPEFRRVCCVLLSVVLLAGCSTRFRGTGNLERDIREGWRNLTIQEFDRAAEFFGAAAELAPASSDLRASALYGLGATHQFRRPGGNPERARSCYRRAIAEDSGGRVAPWAALALARVDFVQKASSRFKRKDLTDTKLREAYRDVIRQYPGTPAMQEASLHLAHSLFAEDMEETDREAIEILEGVLEEYPDSPYLNAIYGALGGYASHCEDQAERYRCMVLQLDTNIDPDWDMRHLLYQIAFHAESRMKRPDLAVPYYRRFLKEYPHDPRCYQVERAAKRLEAALPEEASAGLRL